MNLRRRARRAHPETIVALIDVVFFLLVFFLLVGRMDATAPFEVDPPLAGTGTPMPGGGATVSVAADGKLALDGRVMGGADLTEAVARRLDASPDLLIRVNAHHATDLRHILPLVADLQALGAADIVLVTTPGAP